MKLNKSKKSQDAPSDYELEYRRNLELRQQQIASMMEKCSPMILHDQSFSKNRSTPKSPKEKQAVKRRSRIPVAPTRRSTRSTGRPEGFVYDEMKFENSDSESEQGTTPKNKIRRVVHHKAGPPSLLLVEDVTDAMIANIATVSSKKIYSQLGTSCHQCRQKTLDTKTVCRGKQCVGVRGQFCRMCLIDHYGENVRDALLDKDWTCPCCREICNCSICRTRNNKVPLGQIVKVARGYGYSNVNDFIQSEEASDGDATDKTLPVNSDDDGSNTKVAKVGKTKKENSEPSLICDAVVFDDFEKKFLKIDDVYAFSSSE